MSEEKKDFEVKDRRIFSQDGQNTESADEETPAAPKEEEPAASSTEETRESEAAETSPTDGPDQSAPLPEINFATFVVSLNASALLHLGAIEDPTTGKMDKNLPLAKQTIDILSMLEEKTAGNLSKDEEGLLKNILYDLRIIYVKEKG
ncbi:MAG: DUF1844 domain-containing protein [Desulfobacterales bacterium]